MVDFFATPNRRLSHRMAKRTRLNCYEDFDFRADERDFGTRLCESYFDLLAINQVSLMSEYALAAKRQSTNKPLILALSHGNESADFLHENRLVNVNALRRALNRWRLGALLDRESRHYSDCVDAVVTMSPTESALCQWQGSVPTLYLPRNIEKQPIQRKPRLGRIGFVGSLHHSPNVLGLEQLARSLEQSDKSVDFRIVGHPQSVGAALARRFRCITYVGKLSEQDLLKEVKTWAVFCNPVFYFARGASTKIAEMAGWGIPTVTTFAGRRGYDLPADALVLADTPSKMAAVASEISFDPVRQRDMASRLSQAVDACDDGGDLAPRLVRFLDGLAACEAKESDSRMNERVTI